MTEYDLYVMPEWMRTDVEAALAKETPNARK